MAGMEPARKDGYWCESPNVESHATAGVRATRTASRGSNAGTVVVASVPEGPLARLDAKTSTRAPGTISTRGATRQTTSAWTPPLTFVGGGSALSLNGVCGDPSWSFDPWPIV